MALAMYRSFPWLLRDLWGDGVGYRGLVGGEGVVGVKVISEVDSDVQRDCGMLLKRSR